MTELLKCDCGVDGVDVVIGTSREHRPQYIVSHPRTDLQEQEFLREHSLGGKDMTAITKQALEVIEYIKRYVNHLSGQLQANEWSVEAARFASQVKTPSGECSLSCLAQPIPPSKY